MDQQTTPARSELQAQQKKLTDEIAKLQDRALGAEHNERQAYRLLVPYLVGDLENKKAENEALQEMIRESKDAPAVEKAAGGGP